MAPPGKEPFQAVERLRTILRQPVKPLRTVAKAA